ncbi:MAG: arsenosugar biosynthesis arsenite methyltransferase ArsM [Gammaproteobacteria bacterium]
MGTATYLDTARALYRDAALTPQSGLCCTVSPVWQLPELTVPGRMLEMNYGCGTTVHPRDLAGSPKVLYVGVGGGLELLQFAWFNRKAGAVIGVDAVPEMLAACDSNLREAAATNGWFRREFVDLRAGDALALPIDDGVIDVAAQNCLFNIFTHADLARALREIHRVLRPHGRLLLSDPICEQPIPPALREDDRLRASCLSGALPLREYVDMITGAGFGTVEIRARRPYRVLAPPQYPIAGRIYVESVEICAIKDPIPADGPCVFTGRCAIYFGEEGAFDDGKGHLLANNQPLAVCDKTAAAIERLGRPDILVTPPTWFHDGGGCC